MKVKITNPATNKVIGTIDSSTPKYIHEKVLAAKKAQDDWGNLGVGKRVEILKSVFRELENHLDEIGDMSTKSIGMPVSQRGILDLEAGVEYFKWYLENAEEILKPEVCYEDETSINTVYYQPTGVVAAIAPWNFPFCNFVWSVVPSLIVGNTVVFKHASECGFVGKIIEKCIENSSLPKGVFSEVYGGSKIGDALVHENIDMIVFTGSTAVGKYLYNVAAKKLIKILLELGGSAPGIVFEDANLNKVAETVFFNRFANSGQICDGLKRLIVHKNIVSEVEKTLTEMLSKKKVGDPQDPLVEIGPLVSKRQVNTLNDQVSDALAKGAMVILGGKKPDNLPETYFGSTLLTNISQDMRVWKEEVFGPVLPIITFNTEEEALSLANDTEYGLGGYVLTEDKERANRVAARIKTGMISINGTLYLHPSSPFGGYKKSGIGREHGKYGLHELCQIKVVAMEK